MRSYIIPIAFCTFPFITIAQEVKQDFYEDGKVLREYEVVEGKKQGMETIFYPSGEVKQKTLYRNGLPDSVCIGLYKSGEMRFQLHYEAGLLVDTAKEFHESGSLKKEIEYKDHKQNGWVAYYHENGQLEMKGTMNDELRHGDFEFFDEEGKLEKKGRYYMGQKIGSWKVYDRVGVTNKHYGNPHKPKLPDTLAMVTVDGIGFKLDYPNSWEQEQHSSPSVKFFIRPILEEGGYRPSFIVMVQNAPKEFRDLNHYVDYAEEQSKEKQETYETIDRTSGTKGKIDYQDVISTAIVDFGLTPIKTKFLLRYFVARKRLYQITYSAEAAEFDQYLDDVKAMLDNLEVTK